MRVLLWSELFPPYVGGVERLAAKLVPALRDRGHELRVVTSHDELDLPDEDEYEGALVHRIPFRRAFAAKDPSAIAASTRRALAIKREFAPDVVYVAMIGPTTFAHLTSEEWGGRAPTVVTIQQTLVAGRQGDGTLFGRTLAVADWVAACSESELAEVERRFPRIVGRTSVIPNALDAPDTEPSPLPFHPPRLLCLGRAIRRKGFDLAIETLALLGDRFPYLDLIVAGDGPERPALEHLAARLGLAERVRFLGLVAPDRVTEVIDSSTIMIVPSREQEPFGLVALEAALGARPVVATRVGGLPEVVADGETGVVVPEENPGALAAAVASLLDDPERARALGAAARRRALDRFSFPRYADAYDELLRRVAHGRGG